MFNLVKQAILKNSCSEEDDSLQYHLSTDAFKFEVSSCLFQLKGTLSETVMKSEHKYVIKVVMFLSYQFDSAQTRYYMTE